MDEKKVREAIAWMETERKIHKYGAYKSPTILKEQIDMIEEYYNLAIEALEKQLPKKPVLKRNAYGGISVCPICGASDYGKYCRQCGQRIDKIGRAHV